MIFPIAGLADWIDADGNPLYFFYEQLADVCTRCSDVMMGLACVVIFAGTVMQVSKGMFAGDISGMFKHIVLIGLAVWAMPYYPEWFLDLQVRLGEDLLVALEVDPLSMLINFGESFGEAPFDTGSAPSIVFGVIDPMTWFEYFAKIIGGFVMMIISVFMYVCFYIGFQIQIMAIYLGCAVGPLFIAMLLFEPTRDSAVKYHVGMVGICFWPLGWGLGMLFGEAMMEAGIPLVSAMLYTLYLVSGPFATFMSFITAAGLLVILIIVIAWFLVTLFGAPKVAQKAVTSGAQIGMSLIQGGISASTTMATAAVSAGVQAASGAAQVAGGAALAIGTGGAGAAVGGSMMASGAGSAVGSLGTLAGGVTSAASAASKAADNN